MTARMAKKIERFYNSPEATAFIEEYNRECRVRRIENKELENKGKPALVSPDVLDADDYVFTPYVQERGNGDS